MCTLVEAMIVFSFFSTFQTFVFDSSLTFALHILMVRSRLTTIARAHPLYFTQHRFTPFIIFYSPLTTFNSFNLHSPLSQNVSKTILVNSKKSNKENDKIGKGTSFHRTIADNNMVYSTIPNKPRSFD